MTRPQSVMRQNIKAAQKKKGSKEQRDREHILSSQMSEGVLKVSLSFLGLLRGTYLTLDESRTSSLDLYVVGCLLQRRWKQLRSIKTHIC